MRVQEVENIAELVGGKSCGEHEENETPFDLAEAPLVNSNKREEDSDERRDEVADGTQSETARPYAAKQPGGTATGHSVLSASPALPENRGSAALLTRVSDGAN